jgi:DNA-binding SARP family transcriptional activator/Tfp pilus assembly protein PilF
MRFRILGPLEVQVDESWNGINAPKWRTVLALLLLQAGQVVSTDHLISEVWPEEQPARASNSISIYVLRLRRLISDPEGRVLVTRYPGYQLLVTADDIDAGRFARLASEGRTALSAGQSQRAADLLDQALGLWQGSRALADVPASPLVSAEAGGLEEARIEALELRIQADLDCGRQAQVVAELRRLLVDHPIREGMWALLMRALYSSGRQAEALGAYAQAREVIADELGVEPSAELRQLHEQMLQADAGSGRPGSATKTTAADSPFAAWLSGPQAMPSAATQAGPGESPPGAATAAAAGPADAGPAYPAAAPLPLLAQLPADIPDFTGRVGHLQNLRDLLSGPRRPDSPGAVVVAAVIGAGGLGKTTLAVHAAHLLRPHYPDGQLYANLVRPNAPPVPPGDVLARFLRDLGVDPGRIPVGEEERAAQYRSLLTDRRVLIVLDDARDAAQVRPLLPGSGSCAVLVTTRNRMPDLAGSRFIDLDVLDSAEALDLFASIIGRGRAAAEPEATDDVLTACAGLPLAIRIAGARLAARGGWTVRNLARRLSDERRRLDELKTGDLAVRACFEVSFASLPRHDADDVDPAHAFRLLGTWQGRTIGLPAAAALMGQSEQNVADALEDLVDAQLLQSPAPDRYRFHDLLRAYAAGRANLEETPAVRDGAVRRVLAWYLHTVDAVAQMVSPHHYKVQLAPLEAGCEPLGFLSLDEALNWCEIERTNLVTATRQAAASGLHVVAWQLPVAAFGFFNRRTYWADWVETHQVALSSVRVLGDKRGEALVLNNLGMAFARRRMDEAAGYFEQALAIRREIEDLPGEAQTASNLADTYRRLRRYDEALALLKRALEIQRQAANPYSEAVVLNNLGETYLSLGRVTEAVESLDHAREMFRDIGEIRGEGYALDNLGEAYLSLGRVAPAIGVLERALELRDSAGDRFDAADTLRRLVRAHVARQQPDQAGAYLRRALLIYEELGDEAQASAVRAQFHDLAT